MRVHLGHHYVIISIVCLGVIMEHVQEATRAMFIMTSAVLTVSMDAISFAAFTRTQTHARTHTHTYNIINVLSYDLDYSFRQKFTCKFAFNNHAVQ